MGFHSQGTPVNGAGTKIAGAKIFGKAAAAVATTNPNLDHCTLVKLGSAASNLEVDVKSAVNMGILQREPGSTSLAELSHKGN